MISELLGLAKPLEAGFAVGGAGGATVGKGGVFALEGADPGTGDPVAIGG